MRLRGSSLSVGGLCALALAVAIGVAGVLKAAPQEPRTTTNPVAGQPEAIAEGKALFRSECLYCHGPNARGGGRGPDLTASRLLQSGSDADIYKTVSEGVPGSEMPGSGMRPDEVWNVVAYLRSLGAKPRQPLRGDARAGERVFWEESTCASCHRVNGRGGRLGPDLSRIGAARTPQSLAENIRRPGKDVS